MPYEMEWCRSSGVAEGSSARHEHRSGNECLRLAVEVDQLDVSNLASIENLCRRQVQLELAVERNPVHPDFGGLSEFMGGPINEKGAAATRKFKEWVAGRQRDRAQILKQQRLEKEELAQLQKRQGPKGPKGKPKWEHGPGPGLVQEYKGHCSS